MSGYSAVFTVGAAVFGAAALVAWLLIRPQPLALAALAAADSGAAADAHAG